MADHYRNLVCGCGAPLVCAADPEPRVKLGGTAKRARPSEKRAALPEPEGFAEFWQAWPKKINKGDAEEAWRQMECTAIADQIARAAKEQATWNWSKDGDEYAVLPYPATWLRRKGWLNERAPRRPRMDFR